MTTDSLRGADSKATSQNERVRTEDPTCEGDDDDEEVDGGHGGVEVGGHQRRHWRETVGVHMDLAYNYSLDIVTLTGSSKIKGAKLGEESSVRADWLCIGWPFCQAELRWEFQTVGNFFCSSLFSQALP